jgi:septal ring factor EnvC (AmiA/AmiB activator)
MPLPPTTPPVTPPEKPAYGGVVNRIIDNAKAIATVADQLDRLEREDLRTQTQLLELTRLVFELSNKVSEATGQLKAIEKRLEDKDRLIEATIKLAIKEEADRLRAELRRERDRRA